MKELFDKFKNALRHLEVLHEIFTNRRNFQGDEKQDSVVYKENSDQLMGILDSLKLRNELYGLRGRQMILADLFEYIFLGRGYYSLRSMEEKQQFVKGILYFVNLLMCYEILTVSDNLRNKFVKKLSKKIEEINKESYHEQLKSFKGTIGLKRGKSDAPRYLERYFDSLLPKTAGGLWHELLVYIFLIRNNVGYILPLVLNQRLIGFENNIIPPDFLVITYDKHIYGIEVGIKKEIQSGSFSLQTSIPTATLDTINSRTSDRCPICNKWIPFCEFVISNYSNFNYEIENIEVRCLDKLYCSPLRTKYI